MLACARARMLASACTHAVERDLGRRVPQRRPCQGARRAVQRHRGERTHARKCMPRGWLVARDSFAGVPPGMPCRPALARLPLSYFGGPRVQRAQHLPPAVSGTHKGAPPAQAMPSPCLRHGPHLTLSAITFVLAKSHAMPRHAMLMCTEGSCSRTPRSAAERTALKVTCACAGLGALACAQTTLKQHYATSPGQPISYRYAASERRGAAPRSKLRAAPRGKPPGCRCVCRGYTRWGLPIHPSSQWCVLVAAGRWSSACATCSPRRASRRTPAWRARSTLPTRPSSCTRKPSREWAPPSPRASASASQPVAERGASHA